MKFTKNKLSRILSISLCVLLLCSAVIPAQAAPSNNRASYTTAEQNTSKVLFVSVPSRLPVFVNKDHKVYVADSVNLDNHGAGDMKVCDLYVKAAKDWALAGYTDKLTSGSNLYGWRIQNANAKESGLVSVSGISPMMHGRSTPISYDANVAEHDEPILTYVNASFCVTGYTAPKPGDQIGTLAEDPDAGKIGSGNEDENNPDSEKTSDPGSHTPDPGSRPGTDHGSSAVAVTGVKLNKDALLFTKKGATETLVVTVSPANASNKNVTWASDNPNVATVDKNGKVTAVSSGSATITVTTADGSFTAKCVVAVSIPTSGISLNVNSITLTKKGETKTLTATVSPKEATNKAVTWTSSDPSVATVDQNGKVTAVADGKTVITVKTKDGGMTASCTVTVKINVPVTGVSLDTNKLKLTSKGETKTLIATVSPKDATDKNVTWTSSKTSVATVDQNGKVTAKASGTTTVTVKTKDGGYTDSCTVTVSLSGSGSDSVTPSTVSVTGVSLNKSSLNMSSVGETYTLTATVKPSNATNKAVTWTSSKPGVATVNSNGKVTAVADGTAVITVKTKDGNYTDSCVVTVSITAVVVHPTGILITGDDFTMTAKGETHQLTAVVSPSNTSDKSVVWTSSNPSVATVDQNGLVTAVSNGTAVITVKTVDGNKSDSVTAIVIIPPEAVHPTGVTINEDDFTMTTEGETKQLTVDIDPDNSTNQNVTWTSSDPSVATVSDSGLVTAVSNGTTTITVKTEDGGKTDTITVTVDISSGDDTILPTSVRIEGNNKFSYTKIPSTSESISYNLRLANLGSAQQLVATVSPENATNKTLTWTSSNPDVISVDQNGKVTALKEGKAIIKATTVNGCYSQIDIAFFYGEFKVYVNNRDLVGYKAGSTTDFVIPSVVTDANGFPAKVVSIESGAFSNCDDIVNLTLPDTLRSITGGFPGCDGLVSVTLPNSLTTLGYDSFGNCKNLKSVSIPGSVKTVGGFSFENDTALETVIFGEGIENIGSYAFSGCSALKNVTLPQSLEVIGNSAFYGTAIDSLTIPDAVTEIGDGALAHTKLTSIVIPQSVETLGGSVFSCCENLVTATFAGDKVKTIASRLFDRCESLTDFVIPNSVEKIENRAFYGCQSLTEIVIPDSVTEFSSDGEQFLNCQNLEKVTFSKNMKVIPVCCFGWAAESLAGHADRKLHTVILPEGIEQIQEQAFYSCTALTNIVLPSTLKLIGRSAFCGCKSLSSMVIPNNVTTIGDSAFWECSNMETVTMSSSLQEIGKQAFWHCSKLSSIAIPSGVTEIKQGTFEGCTNLSSVILPNALEQIGSSAFSYAKILSSINIPSSVTEIKYSAFEQCEMLTSINYSGTQEQWAAIEKGNGWDSRTGTYTIHCTDGDIAK